MSDLFLKSVKLKDFRTFGTFETEIVPAPGLTLLVGTNGLGKSSFFDALEWGLTGEVRRFKSYMGSADESRYLTRRGAPRGAQAVNLGFSDGVTLSRGPQSAPTSDTVIALLKREAWTAQIQDIGTYLAFTHFLGQAAQQRFTSREPGEQWQSLKGPSGIDRLDEVRNGLRGRATEMAFNRRVKRETEQVADLDRQVREWQAMATRLTRLREAADAAGALSPEAFAARLNTLATALTRQDPDFIDDVAKASGDRLAEIHQGIEGLRVDTGQRRVFLDGLADLPARFAGQAAAADPEGPAIVEARQVTARSAADVAATVANTAAARQEVEQAAARAAAADAQVGALEAARADHDLVARSHANLARLRTERERLDADLANARLECEKLEADLATIQDRVITLSESRASAQTAAELARLAGGLADLQARARAGADSHRTAEAAAVTARARLAELAVEQHRLTAELEGAGSVVEATQRHASLVASAVAAIASHLHDEDLDCPVCRSHFEPGVLRLLATEAATGQDSALSAAQARHAELKRQLEAVIQEIAECDALVRNAEQARAAAAADATALSELGGRLRAALPDAALDLFASASKAEQEAAQALAAAEAQGAADATQRASVISRLEVVRNSLPVQDAALAALDQQIVGVEAAIRSADERLALAALSDLDSAQFDARLADVRAALASANTERLAASELLRIAVAAEEAARSGQEFAEAALRRLVAARDAASEASEALKARWVEAGLPGNPDAAALEQALAAVAATVREIERLEDERVVLVQSLEAVVRDQELQDLLREIDRIGGKGATADVSRHEKALLAAREAAAAALALSESAHTAVAAFADKLRDEARQFSTQFLTPLNGLIDDFNEALLSTPGETVRLNAAYLKDRTQFDMGLHYRDPVDDALYDTRLPPQVVLSEGQLAANGFSILCAASTAYPWSRWRALLLDDPLQHNDIIHAAAFVDLMRNLVELQRYQLVMSSHDRGEAEFIKRKFDAAGLPCSVIGLTAPSKAGVRYLPPDHNGPAQKILASALAQSA